MPVAPAPAQPTFSGTPKEIVPGGGKQDTGIIVANKNSDTKVTAKDKNGKDISAEFNDKTGSIFLTPDKDVRPHYRNDYRQAAACSYNKKLSVVKTPVPEQPGSRRRLFQKSLVKRRQSSQ